MSIFKNIVVTAIILSQLSCVHSEEVTELASQGDCDAALDKIEWQEAQVSFTETSKQVTGTAASYAATGAGYVADAFVFVGEGTIKTIVYCPYVAAAVAAAMTGQGPVGNAGFVCTDGFKVNGSSYGSKIYRGTQDLRTADFDRISQINREVAQCYQQKGDPESKATAKQRLEGLATDENFLKKLSPEEKDRLMNDFSQLTAAGS